MISLAVLLALGTFICMAEPEKRTSCLCGWINDESSNIIGGDVVNYNKYPFIATLYEKTWQNVPTCGATIISASQVVTAAHCISLPIEQYSILVGVTDLSKADLSKLISVIKAEIYPSFDPETYVDDIVVLTLSASLDFTSRNIGPICLPPLKSSSNLLPNSVKVLGWGKPSGEDSDVLQEVVSSVVSFQQCAKEYPILGTANDERQFCTYDIGKGPSKGDSGGPALWWDQEIEAYTLVGIVSMGPHPKDSIPIIYTLLPFPSYLQWLQNVSNGEICMKEI